MTGSFSAGLPEEATARDSDYWQTCMITPGLSLRYLMSGVGRKLRDGGWYCPERSQAFSISLRLSARSRAGCVFISGNSLMEEGWISC